MGTERSVREGGRDASAYLPRGSEDLPLRSFIFVRLASDLDIDIEDGPKMQPSSSSGMSDRMPFGLALRACILFVIVGRETFHSTGYLPKALLGGHIRTNGTVLWMHR
jgi:hypothetical protein